MSALLPFDINEYRTEPGRLRHRDFPDFLPHESAEACGAIVARWDEAAPPAIYVCLTGPDCVLALAPKVRKVFVRLAYGGVHHDRYEIVAYVDDSRGKGNDLNYVHTRWIGPIFEREIPA